MASLKKRSALLESVGQQIGREVGARSILLHQALANIAGVTVTDMKCLDYVARGTDVTAGDLARVTGLTTGAITAAIDRIEAAGLARRERDEHDRRKVFIRLQQSPASQKLNVIYSRLAQRMGDLATEFTTPQLEAIQDFMLRSIVILREETEAARKLQSPR
jgi:predicted transcriptional regulator